jgi:cation:H+ antiporter
MEQWLEHVVAQLHWAPLFLLIAMMLYALSRGADVLIDEAVILSNRWGVPKVLIGATVVSLGTTTPEAAVSVLAAVQGVADLALGNAVGSIICDTGLILGVAALISPLPLDRTIVDRQGWIQLGAGVLLVVACLPLGSLPTVFASGGRLPQWVGFLFLLLLLIYLWLSVAWARSEVMAEEDAGEGENPQVLVVLLKLVSGIIVVVGASTVLIPAVREAALRLHIPPGVIAATLVAFGTSLPELVTAVTAARRGHGELAIGNVIGADILNVLFVAGVSAAVTSGGLPASPFFFRFLFPAMLIVLVVFRLGIVSSGTSLKRPFGIVLLAVYVAVTVLSYLQQGHGAE